MKILFLAPKIPWPPMDGGRIAIYEPLRHLTARGHQVSFLGFGAASAADELRARAGLQWARAVPHNTATDPGAAALSLLSPLPYTASKYKSAAMVSAVESAFHEERFDLVQLENTHMAHYLSTVQKHGVPTVLRLQNVESLVAERHARTVAPPLSWIMLDQARRWRAFEARACEQASLCLAITPEDAERILALAPEAQVSVSPAGVDLERFYPKLMTEEPDTVVFIGALDWPPNVDGARWFRSEIWPLIRKADPEARWIVVGKGAPADILAWPESDRSIQVTGFVEDVRPYLHSGALVVVPVRSGGGMRLKILEAMAAGKTVLTTPVGAEGIDARNGEEIFLAPANKTFAEAALRILRDESLRKRTGKAAAAWVARFGWDKIAASLENEYRALLDSRRP